MPIPTTFFNWYEKLISGRETLCETAFDEDFSMVHRDMIFGENRRSSLLFGWSDNEFRMFAFSDAFVGTLRVPEVCPRAVRAGAFFFDA